MSGQGLATEYGNSNKDVLILLRSFAASEHFRSATTDELEIDNDFFRRPLRPEDLAFIEFTRPVGADTICDLPSLASQRILRCLYDMPMAWLPRNGSLRPLDQRAHFYNDTNASDIARLTSFLERFAFGFLGVAVDGRISRAQLCDDFERLVGKTAGQTVSGAGRIAPGDFSEETLRFLLIQEWCLSATKHRTIAKTKACGYFDVLSRENWPQSAGECAGYRAMSSLALKVDIDREPHTFWQFYLATSLGKTNHLSALAAHPESCLSLVGAAFVAESEWRRFVNLVSRICQEIGLPWLESDAAMQKECRGSGIVERFSRAVSAIEEVLGVSGLAEFSRGVRTAARLAELAALDLEAQLRWLGSINDYTAIAQQLDHRIQTEKPDIDRETFIEPREMCSTTHVHNDHRLVVIESGNMVFWGFPGMRHRMSKGEMILVPRGRLHGSSVESEKCVYHQPIIPDDWVRPLIAEAEQRHGWEVQRLSA